VPEPVDLVVYRGVLLDVGVRPRDVGLWLVVVVVGDEELDAVVRQHVAELGGELGGERLVGLDDQGRPLELLDHPGDGGGLARAGDPFEGLEAQPVEHAARELGDRLGLVASGLERRLDAERSLGAHDASRSHSASTSPTSAS
jgi:hypothetical protein